MASIRHKITLQQKRKADKRLRGPSDIDESSILTTGQHESDDEMHFEHDEDSGHEEEEENRQVIEFQRGTTERGALCLWHLGFRYVRSFGGQSYFRCSNRDCSATAKLISEETTSGVIGGKEHNHLPDPAHRKAEEKRNDIRARMKENKMQKSSKVLAEVRSNVTDEVFVRMGTDQALKAVIRRNKKKIYGNVDLVNPLAIVLPNELLMKDGQSTLLYDSRLRRVGESDVVLLFAHPKQLDILTKARKFSMDGTFKVSPAAWTQVFVIGAFVKRRLVLCAHALLPGKHKRYYSEALNALMEAIAPSAPARVIIDFENAAIQAVQETFPTTQLTGCLFHFPQAVFRKWRSMGLAELYANDAEQGEAARNSFRMVLALALIPEQYVRHAFSLITDHAPDGLAAFFAYFARVYIGLNEFELELGANAFLRNAYENSSHFSATVEQSTRSFSSLSSVNLDHFCSNNSVQFGIPSPRPSSPTMSSFAQLIVPRWELRIVRQPRYPLNFWNVHDRARSMAEKTNNAMEASHLQFSRGLVHHPSLSDFLAALLDDIDKQIDIARSSQMFKHDRRTKYVLKEQLLGDALDEAEYNTDADIMNILALLSLQMQGYVGGLRVNTIHGEEDED